MNHPHSSPSIFLRELYILSRTAVGLCIKAHGPLKSKFKQLKQNLKSLSAWITFNHLGHVTGLLNKWMNELKCLNLLPKNCNQKHFINQNYFAAVMYMQYKKSV